MSPGRPHGISRNEGEPDAEAELVALMAETGSSKERLWDAVAGELALGFSEDTLSYNFCDDLANLMFGWLDDDSNWPGVPDFFMRVYLAFDAGECHRGDAEDVDPEVEYTRPLIAEIVRELREA